jgi:hypothetical protein
MPLGLLLLSVLVAVAAVAHLAWRLLRHDPHPLVRTVAERAGCVAVAMWLAVAGFCLLGLLTLGGGR